MAPGPSDPSGDVAPAADEVENQPLLPTTNTGSARNTLRSRNSRLSAGSAQPSQQPRSSFGQFVEVLSAADQSSSDSIAHASDIESGVYVPNRSFLEEQARQDSRIIRGSVAVLDSEYEENLERKHPKIIQFLTSYKGILLQVLICVCTGALDLYETVFRQKSADVKRAHPVNVNHKCTGQTWKTPAPTDSDQHAYDPFYATVDDEGKTIFKISKFGASTDPEQGKVRNNGMWCLRAKRGRSVDSFEDMPVTFEFGGEERTFDSIDELKEAWREANEPQSGTPKEDDIIKVHNFHVEFFQNLNSCIILSLFFLFSCLKKLTR